MSKAIVTGGAGFIGSHLVEALVEKGFDVTVIDNLISGRVKNLKNVLKDITFVQGNILSQSLLFETFKDADYVFHQAALRSVRSSVKEPHIYNQNNLDGTLNVLEAAKANNVKRVIFASSSSIYGDPFVFPVKEDFLPAPKSTYAITKIAGEYYCKMYYDLFGLETISLRYFNVFGSRQDFYSAYATLISLFTYKVLHDETPEIFGDGEQSRDFTYVSDVVEANLKALKVSKHAIGEAFNVCNGIPITVNEILRSINTALGKNVKPKYIPPKLGDVRKTQGDPTQAKEILGFECRMPFEKGLQKTIDWMKEEKPWL